MFNRTQYQIGQTIEMPYTGEDDIRVGNNSFVNVSKFRRISIGKYPQLKQVLTASGNINNTFEWKKNPNWNNVTGYMLTDVNVSPDIHNQIMVSNKKTDSSFMFVLMCINNQLVYGSYSQDLKYMAVAGSAHWRSATYHNPTESWFFGNTAGRVYIVTNADLMADIAPTLIPTTPLAGFGNDVYCVHSVKASGTLLHTSTTNEVARSTDNGVNWTNVAASTGGVPYTIQENATGDLFMSCSGGNFRRSVDDGVTWTIITKTDATTLNRTYSDVNPVSGRVIITGTNMVDVFAIDDISSGNVYKLQATVGWPRPPSKVTYIGDNRWIIALYDTSDFDPNYVMCKYSEDDGDTWSDLMTRKDTDFNFLGLFGYNIFYDGIDTVIYGSSAFDDYTMANVSIDTQSYTLPMIKTTQQGFSVFMCVK